jgi:hypothetical protein
MFLKNLFKKNEKRNIHKIIIYGSENNPYEITKKKVDKLLSLIINEVCHES